MMMQVINCPTNMFKTPSPGVKVTVTTRWRNYSIHATSPTSDMVTTGKVLPSERWDQPGTFRVFTGDPRHAVAVIPLEKVVEMKDDAGTSFEEHIEAAVSNSWQVAGSKGDTYTVLQVGGKWSCSCVGFQYRRQCKHIDEKVKEQQS